MLPQYVSKNLSLSQIFGGNYLRSLDVPSQCYVGSDLSDTESDTSLDTSAKDTSRDEDSNKSACGMKKGDILPIVHNIG